MNVKSSDSHFRALDFYRFLAAVGVVVFHYGDYVGRIELPNLRHMVDFFFMLSGFVIMNTYREMRPEKLGVYLVRRFARIYPLHLATLLFFVVYAALRWQQTGVIGPQYSLSSFVSNILMLHAWNTTGNSSFNGPSWSISAEWFVYLLFPFFLLVYRKFELLGLLTLTAVAFSLAIGSDLAFPDRSWMLRTYDWGALRAVPAFLAGMSLNVLPRIALPWWPAKLSLLGFAVLIFFRVPAEAFALTSAIVIFLTCNARGHSVLESRQAGYLGNLSYGVYMLHMPIAAVLFGILARFLPRGSGVALSIAGFCLVLLAAAISFRWFEIPARDVIRRILEPLARRPSRTRKGVDPKRKADVW